MGRVSALILAGAASWLSCAFSLGPFEVGPPDGTPKLDSGNGGRDSGISSGDGGLVLDYACGALTSKRCAYYARCGLISSDSLSAEDCAAYFQATWCNDTLWPARVRQGTLGYDPLGALACAGELDSAPCADFARLPPACESFLSPVVPLGGLCYGTPYSECREGVCRGVLCPYSCEAPGLLSEACEQDSDCQQDAGLYCRFSLSVSQCAALGTLGAGCDELTRCGPGLYCKGGALPGADGGLCEPTLDAGAACASSAQCHDGQICLNQTKRCASAGPLALGSPCYPEQSCQPGTTCFGTGGGDSGVCQPPRFLGDACGSALDCEANLGCPPSVLGQVCSVRLTDGALCNSDRDCWWGARCVDAGVVGAVCARIPRPGDACLFDTCLYGECSADAGLCSGFASAGEACSRDLDCASDRCMEQCLSACGP